MSKRGYARTFGQDLMRGEHIAGGGKVAQRQRGCGENSTPRSAEDGQGGLLIDGGSRQSGMGAQQVPHTASLQGGLVMGPSMHPYDGIVGNGAASQTGTSIFDPVLCELVYRWFCPPGGAILDPFAGGSVRGIVAARLGYAYTGIDLRAEQVAANEAQWASMQGGLCPSLDGAVPVKVSAAMARLTFHGCEPAYIRDVCHAACCHSSTSATGTLITIHPLEQARIEARGGQVENGLLLPRPGEKQCPFESPTHLCGLHETPEKPFGCIASPFTLTKTHTLIVRNRYKLLKCFKDGSPPLPAYKAFSASLRHLFGDEEAARIAAHLDDGGGDCVAYMPARTAAMLLENDAIKQGHIPSEAQTPPMAVPDPRWLVGDSMHIAPLAPGAYDLVFSCPPYGDLECYSDDPLDLSTMDYAAFADAYRAIIAASVGLLKPDRFACFVVGDIRDPAGYYRGLPALTQAAFAEAGARLYNDAVLVTAVGSLPIRISGQFQGNRKLGKTHQNVLIFCKGDWRKAVAACGDVDMGGAEADGETE